MFRTAPSTAHSPTTRRRLLLGSLLATSLSLAGTAPALASSTQRDGTAAESSASGVAQLGQVAPVMSCGAVTELSLAHVTDGKVTITSAKEVHDGTTNPYCEVTATIAPASQVMVRLPLSGWSRRYLQTGCGGLCGRVSIDVAAADSCTQVDDGSLVTATTDMGHEGKNDGSWALDDPQAVIDFSYRSVHDTAQVAKALIRHFYGTSARYSYFDGCSDGGREALMEAQRYPKDFDGIVAGAPANDIAVQNTVHHAWNVLTNLDAQGRFILLADKLPLVHRAVLSACDGLDGVRDGLLQDPSQCHFNPASLVCKPGQDASSCLTAAQAAVVRRLHDGATDDAGTRLEQADSHPWGSELSWSLFVPAAQGDTSASEGFALSYLRYLVDPNHQNPSMTLSQFHFTVASFWKAVKSSSYSAALDPNLTAFRRHGGKLILWHGWADQHISPQSTIDYYTTVRRTMGAARTDSFTKLYLFPGVTHCGGGEGPDQFDLLTPLMAWREGRRAPSRVVASAVGTDGAVTMTRPVYPYPQLVRYTGHGSTNDAANFTPYTPTTPAGNFAPWIGQALYSSGYQTTCHADGTHLVCRLGYERRH